MILHRIKFYFFILFPLSLYLIPTKFIFTENHVSICLFKLLSGRECWGCGTTRAVFSLLHFKWNDAYAYNKLIVIIAPLIAFLWIKEIFRTYRKIKQHKSDQTVIP